MPIAICDPKKLEEFYLEAARRTWAANAPKRTIVELPQSKELRYERDGLTYVDTYFAPGHTRGSCGLVMIFQNNIPVWWMQFHGECLGDPQVIIPFLKRALLDAYAIGRFIGGRGPERYTEAPEPDRHTEIPRGFLVYSNHYEVHTNCVNTFTGFEGREAILQGGWLGVQEVFWHRYCGGIL